MTSLSESRNAADALRADLSRRGYETVRAGLAASAYRADVRAVVLYRLQQWATHKGNLRLAQALCHLNQLTTGAEFVVGCVIGPGLLVKHPNGIVVGQGVVIGKNCTLLHQVTLGERRVVGSGPHLYPKLGDDVILGAKCTVLGAVAIGDRSEIGAHALVLDDVPAGSTVVGFHRRSRNQS